MRFFAILFLSFITQISFSQMKAVLFLDQQWRIVPMTSSKIVYVRECSIDTINGVYDGGMTQVHALNLSPIANCNYSDGKLYGKFIRETKDGEIETTLFDDNVQGVLAVEFYSNGKKILKVERVNSSTLTIQESDLFGKKVKFTDTNKLKQLLSTKLVHNSEFIDKHRKLIIKQYPFLKNFPKRKQFREAKYNIIDIDNSDLVKADIEYQREIDKSLENVQINERHFKHKKRINAQKKVTPSLPDVIRTRIFLNDRYQIISPSLGAAHYRDCFVDSKRGGYVHGFKQYNLKTRKIEMIGHYSNLKPIGKFKIYSYEGGLRIEKFKFFNDSIFGIEDNERRKLIRYNLRMSEYCEAYILYNKKLLTQCPYLKHFPNTRPSKLFESRVVNEPKEDEDKIYTVIEQSAEYSGGSQNLDKFLQDNLVYPEDARNNNIQGIVYVQFVILRDGTITDLSIAKPLSKECNLEAIRLIKLSGPWKPGRQNGKVVNCMTTIPIKFTLQ
jgi:TonB family protein